MAGVDVNAGIVAGWTVGVRDGADTTVGVTLVCVFTEVEREGRLLGRLATACKYDKNQN